MPEIEALLERFTDKHGEYGIRQSRTSSLQAPASIYQVNSLKRKHDSRRLEPDPKRRRIQCSPKNIIAFLVLALGATTSGAEDKSTDIHPDNETWNRDPPGLQYYAQANDLMAGHMDGDDLVHAHMFLLAGMYKSRLGRIQEASSWYFMAGRVLLRLLDRHDIATDHDEPIVPGSPSSCEDPKTAGDNARLTTPSHERSIVLAAWACLNLESEVVPELRLPRSGLENSQQSVPLPEELHDGHVTDGRNSLLANITLVANREAARLGMIMSLANQQLLPDHSAGLWPEQLRVIIKSQTASLYQWRTSLPDRLRWNDQDPPPNCNVTASLRRRYWEAKVTLLKPFLHYALHILPDIRNGNVPQEIEQDLEAGLDTHVLAAVHVTMRKSGESEILRLADLCIEAAKKSIAACERVSDRQVLINAPCVTHRYVTARFDVNISVTEHQTAVSTTSCFLQLHIGMRLFDVTSQNPS